MPEAPFVFESRLFLFPKRKPPLAFAAHSILKNPPPAKNQNGEERQGDGAGGAELPAGGGVPGNGRNRSVLGGFKPPRTRRVRSGFAQSVELDHKNNEADTQCPVIIFFSALRGIERRRRGCHKLGGRRDNGAGGCWGWRA